MGAPYISKWGMYLQYVNDCDFPGQVTCKIKRQQHLQCTITIFQVALKYFYICGNFSAFNLLEVQFLEDILWIRTIIKILKIAITERIWPFCAGCDNDVSDFTQHPQNMFIDIPVTMEVRSLDGYQYPSNQAFL